VRFACAALLLLSVFLAGLLTACATVDATTTQYVGVPRFEPSDPKKVQILRSDPAKPFDRLGEIHLTPSVDPAPSVEDIEARFRFEAAAIGADAVIVIVDRTVPVIGYGPVRQLIGLPIHYR